MINSKQETRMKVSEILEKIISGEMVLETAGHEAYAMNKEVVINSYKRCLEFANGKGDGTWNKHNKKGDLVTSDERMREHYQDKLDMEIEEDEPIVCSIFNSTERLFWTLTGNKLQVRTYLSNKKEHRENPFVNHPIDYVCPYSVHKPNFGEITVKSKLLISNFFRKFSDEPEGEKYSQKYSLSSLSGQEAITAYKATHHNVAFGQMSNMSIGVFINKAKDSIIIGPGFHPAEMKDYDNDEDYYEEIKKPIFEGYELVGTISLGVWRWEATDLNTLGKEEYKELKNKTEVIELDVPHGTWSFQHNFNFDKYEDGSEENLVYAKLELKKN